jgi:hypothetical protein
MKYTILAVVVATALLSACGGTNAAELVEGGQLLLMSF